jgi:hypothetical protein
MSKSQPIIHARVHTRLDQVWVTGQGWVNY